MPGWRREKFEVLIHFKGCGFATYPDIPCCETVWHDGQSLVAAPEQTSSYRHTADQLGYGRDLWRMCREHEAMHHLVAEWRGLPYSPTLRAEAMKLSEAELPIGERHNEEAVVLSLQRMLNTGEAQPVLSELAEFGLLEVLVERARGVCERLAN